jgi:hypothetical protein
VLRLQAPRSLRLRRTLWSASGRALSGDSFSLEEGVYSLGGITAPGAGVRFLELTWSGSTGADAPVRRGRWVRALAFP